MTNKEIEILKANLKSCTNVVRDLTKIVKTMESQLKIGKQIKNQLLGDIKELEKELQN